MSSANGFRRRRLWAIVLLAVACAVVAIEAWFPLGPRRTTVGRDAPTVDAGMVTFAGRSVLVSAEAPAWLGPAIDTGVLEVELSFNAASGDQGGPARLLAISSDVRHADLMIGQEGEDLVVRVRRAGSDPSGDPGFVAAGVVRPGSWQALSVEISGARLGVDLDGQRVIDEVLSTAAGGTALSSWDRSYRVALGDEPDGDREWTGSIRQASVTTTDGTADLLEPGMLEPGTERVVVVRDRTILRPPDGSPLFVVFRLLIFLPVGMALGWIVRPWWAAAGLCVVIPAVLAVGKLFVEGRHPGSTEVAVGAAGALVGAAVVRAGSRRPTPDST